MKGHILDQDLSRKLILESPEFGVESSAFSSGYTAFCWMFGLQSSTIKI